MHALATASLLPVAALNLPRPPPPRGRLRRGALRAPLAAGPSSRQPYRRARDRPPARAPAPAPRPPPPREPQQRGENAAAPDARGMEELEDAIYDFMCRSARPGAFPTREELIAAGRADLAAAVASCGGWLSLGWRASDAGNPASTPPSGGAHPDYPPAATGFDHDLAQDAGDDAGSDEEEASPSDRQPREEDETRFETGIDGMLSRLQRDREQARSSTLSEGRSDNGALVGNNSACSHTAAGGRYIRSVPENRNVREPHPQNGTLEDNKAFGSSSSDTWRTWNLGKGGLSEFEAAEVVPYERKKLSQHDELDIVLAQDINGSPNGVAVSDYASDVVSSESDEIKSRLQNLELDLTDALKSLRSRFDKILSDMSNVDGAIGLDDISDDWEFEETKVMQAGEELRSIRAKIAVLEGKMALEIIERNKIIEDKQRRLDEVEKSLSELRTVCIEWPNPASEVVLVGSFDGWTKHRKMERSGGGIFSLNLRLYPGRYEIKFIVDGVWMNDPLRPTVFNNGNENNLLIVD